MKKISIVLITCLTFAGCAKPKPLTATDVSAKVTDLILVVNPVLTPPACPPKIIDTSDHALQVLVRYTAGTAACQYHAIIGPESRVGLMADASLFVCKGWVYVWTDTGSAINPWPWVQTAHVAAGADGCRFGVEVNLLGTYTNVFFFADQPADQVKVMAQGTSTIQTNNDIDFYQHVEFGAYTKNAMATGSREQQRWTEMSNSSRAAH